jgi:hypothetical protein
VAFFVISVLEIQLYKSECLFNVAALLFAPSEFLLTDCDPGIRTGGGMESAMDGLAFLNTGPSPLCLRSLARAAFIPLMNITVSTTIINC